MKKFITQKQNFIRFSVDSKLNVYKHSETTFKRGEIFVQPGAAHADDLCYLFR